MSWTPEMRDKAATTRQQNKEAKALRSTGVGESRNFGDPDAPDPYAKLRECHIGGKRVGDSFDETQLSMLQYRWTDEGIAEENERVSAKNGGAVASGVSVSDPLQKQLQRKRDDVLSRGMETFEASDPMREVIGAHGRPGFNNRFLSDETVKKRGLRGWQPVIKDGEPVKLGGMTLGEMPAEKAKQRNEHYRELGNQRLRQVTENYKEAAGSAATSDQ